MRKLAKDKRNLILHSHTNLKCKTKHLSKYRRWMTQRLATFWDDQLQKIISLNFYFEMEKYGKNKKKKNVAFLKERSSLCPWFLEGNLSHTWWRYLCLQWVLTPPEKATLGFWVGAMGPLISVNLETKFNHKGNLPCLSNGHQKFPVCLSRLRTQPVSMRMQGQSLASLSGLGIQHCRELHRCGLDLALLWLWWRPAAAAPFNP